MSWCVSMTLKLVAVTASIAALALTLSAGETLARAGGETFAVSSQPRLCRRALADRLLRRALWRADGGRLRAAEQRRQRQLHLQTGCAVGLGASLSAGRRAVGPALCA